MPIYAPVKPPPAAPAAKAAPVKLRPAKADKRGRPRTRKDDKRYVKFY